MVRAGLGLILVWLALLLTQVFVLVLALTPLALSGYSTPRVAAMIAASLLPALLVSAFAVRELRGLKHLEAKQLREGAPSDGDTRQH